MAEPRPIADFIERDLTALVSRGEIEPAFEIDPAIDSIRQFLRGAAAAPAEYRRFPMLVGDAGVGKSAIVRELARRAPPELGGRRMVTMDLAGVAAKHSDYAKARLEVDQALVALKAEAAKTLAVLRGLTTMATYNLVARLGSALDDPRFLVMAEVRTSEHRWLVENRPDVATRFLPVMIDEPEPARLERILDAWCAHRAQRLSTEVDPEAVRVAIELTDRLVPGHRQPRKTIDLLSLASAASGGTLSAEQVVDWFATLHAVPRFLVSPDEPLDLQDTARFFRSRLLGQDEAIDAVLHMIAAVKAGLSDVRRPLGAFLFVGPTGVGKTHIAQLLAEYLFGSRHAMLRINMMDFASPNGAAELFGDPASEIPSAQRGVLAQRLIMHPFGVLLLDELEKTHPLVHDRLLQLVDEGRYLNGAGDTVYCNGLVVIATTNAGSEAFRERGIGFLDRSSESEALRQMMREAERTFRFEFLNRFDRIVAFRPLRREEIRELARRELESLLGRSGLRRRRLDVEVDDTVLDLLAAHGYDPLYGARFLRREIERRVVGPIAETLARAQPPPGSRLGIHARGGQLAVGLTTAREERVSVPTADGERRERLDRDALLERGRALTGQREPVATSVATAREEVEQLVARTSMPGFWNEPASARKTLDACRHAELQASAAEAALRALDALAEATGRGGRNLTVLGRTVEQAQRALEHWRALSASSGGPAWIVIGPADAVRSDLELVPQLVEMYRGWAARCSLEIDPVAEEALGDRLVRVVLHADGANALGVLEMEHGVHRAVLRRRGTAITRRALVEILPANLAGDGDGIEIRDLKHGAGLVVPRVTARCSVDVASRGARLELRGRDRTVLATLAPCLAAAPAPDLELARTYGEGGTGARDPRTGAVMARAKDALAGDLGRFLTAWRAGTGSGDPTPRSR